LQAARDGAFAALESDRTDDEKSGGQNKTFQYSRNGAMF
jgi:hypothetical protein